MVPPAVPLEFSKLAAHCSSQLRCFADEAAKPAGSSTVADPSAAAASAAQSIWARFVKWSYRTFSGTLYPEKADICNCGADLGLQIPRPELVMREGIKQGSKEWRMQMYGAALYWHLATTPGESARDVDPEMMKGKDVLEVACFRGGGSRYLAEVAGTRRYVATDNIQEHVDICHRLHSEHPGLTFELADALELPSRYTSNEFDFVLCIQAAAQFSDLGAFVRGAWHVLRPGGRLIIADALTRDNLKSVLDALDEMSFVIDANTDLSRAVHAVGLCQVFRGVSYLRIVARKVE